MKKIVSWNVNSLRVRLPQVSEWLSAHKPAVLGLQETKLTDENFPVKEIEALGYHAYYSGEKTYNGVALLSQKPLTDIETVALANSTHKRIIAGTFEDFRLINVYVPNGESITSEKYPFKQQWLRELTHYLVIYQKKYEKIVVMGDFNIAPADIDVHDPEQWKDSVLTHSSIRAQLQNILTLGFHDTFRKNQPEIQEYSWWDYRIAAFRRNLGLRIDLMLATDAAIATVQETGIDKEARAADRPSDHAPVWTSFS